MLLRESSPTEGLDVAAVTDATRDSGVAHGARLVAIVDACIGRRWDALGVALDDADATLGRDAARDALIVAAAFNGITRIADATGIPLDPSTATATAALRRDIGIDRFDYSAKSARFDR